MSIQPFHAPIVATWVVSLFLLFLPGCATETIPEVEGREILMNESNFDAEALQADELVLVDFGATWCGPCRQMEPKVAYLSVEYGGRLKVGKVDIDESPNIANEYGIESIPTLALFRDGQEIARDSGVMSYQGLAAWVDRHLME